MLVRRRNDYSSTSGYFRRIIKSAAAFRFNIKNYNDLFKIQEGDSINILEWKNRINNLGKDINTFHKIKQIVWVDWFKSPYLVLDTKPETFVELEDLSRFVIYTK